MTMVDVIITYKGTTVAGMDNSGTKTLKTAGKYCEGDIAVSYIKPTPMLPDPSKPVKFFDYDGILVYSYTPAEFAALTAMPDNPVHDGLTAQGWNWTLADAKSYVAECGRLVIGQNYITSDGKTRLYIHVDRSTNALNLKFASGNLDIDWGDGSEHDTISAAATVSHKYPDAEQDYTIVLTPAENTTWKFGGYFIRNPNISIDNIHTPLKAILQKVELGAGITELTNYCFEYCTSLVSISIPKGVSKFEAGCIEDTSISFLVVPNGAKLGQWAFQYSRLKYIALPKTVVYDGREVFAESTNLLEICLPVKTSGQIVTNSFLSGCESLHYACVPDGGATIIPMKMFYGCYSLGRIRIPASISQINYSSGSPFGNTRLVEVQFMSLTPPTLVASGVLSPLPSYAVILCPHESIIAYKGATNYPSASSTKYIGCYKGTAGETLPATITDNGVTHDLVWYASVSDARNENAPITTMQGDEVYCLSTPQPEEDPT